MDKKLSKLAIPLVAAAILANASINKQTVEYNDNSTIIQNNIIEDDCEDCQEDVQNNVIYADIIMDKQKKRSVSLLKRLKLILYPECYHQDDEDINTFNENDFHKPGCTCFGPVENREYRRLNNPLWAPYRGICSHQQSHSMFRRVSPSVYPYRISPYPYKEPNERHRHW